MSKSIEPHNDKNEKHGFHEVYWDKRDKSSQLMYKGHWINGLEVGYEENYTYVGELSCKQFHIR